MNIFFELHKDIVREGPGNRATTKRVFQSLGLSNAQSILDVGCGPGEQTIVLAHLSASSSITAVDTHAPFLQELERRAVQEGVGGHIQAVQASMFELDFAEHSFDVIWSEGAIYIMGFGEGVAAWKRLLKPGGYMVVSELSWLTDAPSEDAIRFWEQNYPGMKSIAQNAALVRNAGYELLQHVLLPQEGWWEDYYNPLESRIASLRPRYTGDAKALAVLDGTQEEIDLYRQHFGEYGYVFYVMKKEEM